MPTDQSSLSSQTRWLIKLVILALSVMLVFLLFGSALGHVLVLTNPGCNDDNPPLPDIPKPDELWLINPDGQEVRASTTACSHNSLSCSSRWYTTKTNENSFQHPTSSMI
jgi:hypothetical protein